MNRTQLWTSILIAFFFTGCVMQEGQLKRDASFSESSATALVVFGVDVQSEYKSPLMTFRKYDPQTGKVDLSDLYHVSPRIDKLTGSQKFDAAMSGQSSRPGGRDYFVIGLPPGDWFLWAMSGLYQGNGTAYDSTTFFSQGTFVIHATAGTATYIGEYSITGKFGGELRLISAPANFDAAQAELHTFPNVRQNLVQLVPVRKKFTCVEKLSIVGKFPCDPASIVLSDL